MALSEAQEKKIAELRAGITAAPATGVQGNPAVVANNRSCLLEVFLSIDQLKLDLAASQREVAALKAELDDTETIVPPKPVL